MQTQQSMSGRMKKAVEWTPRHCITRFTAAEAMSVWPE